MLVQILVTAAVSAVTTIILAGLLYWLFLRPRLEQQMAAAIQEIEDGVKRGVEAAGVEMLPEFRTQVREGFLEAIAQWPSSEFRNVTRTGAGIMEDGLSTLFGRRPKK